MATQPITTAPKTPAQMKVVIDRLKKQTVELQDSVFLTGVVATATLAVGDVVYADSATNVTKAIATGLATSRVLGISTAIVAAGSLARIQTEGIVLIPGAGFTFNQIYYLSESTAGLLTLTAPTSVTETVVAVGIAVSAEQLLLLSVPPILL